MNNISTAEIMDRGLNCLIEKLGLLDTERFISTLIREKFDYTKWLRLNFGNMNSEDFNEAAAAYGREHPLSGH